MKRVILCALLLLAGFSTRSYVLRFDASGQVRHWNFVAPNPGISTNSFNPVTHAIRFYIKSDAYSTTNTMKEINAVRSVFGQWQSVHNTIIKFEDAGLVAPGYQVNSSDGTNVVLWVHSNDLLVNGTNDNISGSLGVTYSSSFPSDNTVAEFDIVLNGAENTWFTDFNDQNNPGQFVEGTVTHEVGHVLGLNHSTIGGATMLAAGQTGVDTTAGLSVDEVAFARAVYPASNILSTLGKITGTVTKNGSPVFGAVIIVENTNGNLAGGTITRSGGLYSMTAFPPGNYNVRVWPLDSANAASFLINGPSVGPEYAGADTNFLPRQNIPVTLSAGVTNTLNLVVTNGIPGFRIAYIRIPTQYSGDFSVISLPQSMSPGQSNYFIGVLSRGLPTSGATFKITGDGLTIGPPQYDPGLDFGDGLVLNAISASISVASNATPGLRTFIVSKGATNAYANGFLEILPIVPDYNFDGLNDVFQRAYFPVFTSTNAAPGADPDHDGFNNYAEYLSGTNPTNSSSFLKIQSITTTAGGTTIVWPCSTGKHFQVMSRTNAMLGTWTNVGAIVTATGSTAQFLDPSATNGTRFYRIQALP